MKAKTFIEWIQDADEIYFIGREFGTMILICGPKNEFIQMEFVKNSGKAKRLEQSKQN